MLTKDEKLVFNQRILEYVDSMQNRKFKVYPDQFVIDYTGIKWTAIQNGEHFEINTVDDFRRENNDRLSNSCYQRWRGYEIQKIWVDDEGGKLKYDWRNAPIGFYVNRVILLPHAIEEFKNKYPYCPIDEFRSWLCNEGTWEDRDRYGYTNTYGMVAKDDCIDTCCVIFMLMYQENPQIETLFKANSWFRRMIFDWIENPDNNDKYRKAFAKKNNINDITGMPNWLWTRLCDEQTTIGEWDFYRIYNKQLATEKGTINIKKGHLVYDGIDEAFYEDLQAFNGDINTLKKVKSIVKNAKDANGKAFFTMKSMLNYLERVDMYQAIPRYESIKILSDYLGMCKQMDVVPRVDSDSLKREHDVMARNHNTWMKMKRAEFDKEKGGLFKEVSKKLQKYEFEDDTYTAIVPKEIKDLINEGCNNHNCVGSYVDNFAKGKSNVFFIRKKDNLEKSYITIELTSSCENYKQAYLGSNQRITNHDDWEFIDKWMEHNKEINKGAN